MISTLGLIVILMCVVFTFILLMALGLTAFVAVEILVKKNEIRKHAQLRTGNPHSVQI
jgi:hypothetical protein